MPSFPNLSCRACVFTAVAGIFLLTSSTNVWADEVNVSSRVAAATIFPDRAIVTREAKTHVTAGPHTIVIADVPAGLDESSLRVQGKATVDVKIGTVEVKRVFLTEAANAAQREKTAALEAKQGEKALAEAEIKALESREAFIDRIVSAGADKTDSAGVTKLDFTPEKWAQAWNLVQTGMTETQKGLATKKMALDKLDEEITKLQQELAQVQSTHAKERRDVHIQIEAAQDTDLQLSLNYQTFGARWAPVYDARLDTGNAALTLEQYGQAAQQTGEDWTNVELTLSTAQPSFGSEMPQLREWVVQLYKRMEARAFNGANLATASSSSPAAQMRANADAAKKPFEEKDVVAQTQQAIVQSSEYAAEFRVPGQVDLKSANDPTKMFIGSAHMKATLSSQVTPRLVQQAYLFAKATNGEKYPLVPGLVAKYRDGAFIGNAAMSMLRPGETADLSFGTDDRVKVMYRRTHEEKNNPTLIVVGDMSAEREYETKIQNLHKDPIDITVFEQYPVSNDADVKSEILDDTTTPGYGKDLDNRQGIIVWSASLKPQEEKTYTIGFRVKYPKDGQLMGL